LAPVADYGVVIKVVFSKFVVSSSKFITTSFEYGGELSSSMSLLVIKLADTKNPTFYYK
jgi:hypothetical protein